MNRWSRRRSDREISRVSLIAASSIAILIALSSTVPAQQVTPKFETSDSLDKQRQTITESVRYELRRRLSYAEMPQFRINEEPAEYLNDGLTWTLGDPQSGRTPRTANPADTAGRQFTTLTLDEVLNLIDLYHPKLRGADAERRIASAKRLEKQGAFDPVVYTGFDYLRFNTEFDSKLNRGKIGSSRIADAGVEFLTRYGVKIFGGARYNLGKIKSPLSPTGDGGEYFIEMKIPLLRGAGINEKAAAERQAFLGEPFAQTEFQLTRLDLILKAANSYWDWVAAKRRLDIARNLLDLATFRADAIRQQVQAGDLPQIDSVEADLEVQRRRGNLVKGDRDLQKAAFKLSLFLWTPYGSPAPIPVEANAPSTTPPPVVLTDDQAQVGQRLALDRRPELEALRITQDITRVDLDLAENQRLPVFDLALGPGRDTGFGAIGNTVKAGVNLSVPLRQRTADGRIAAANLKLEKLNLDLINERQRITTEVLDAVSAINAALERYNVALQEVQLAQALEEGERTRFALGDSTLFLVNQRERATAEARIKLIDIQIEYEQAVAAFRTVTVQY